MALVLGCGHRGSPELDEDGRELVTCRIGAKLDDECILDTDTERFHCVPADVCMALCGGNDFVCE